MSIRIAILWHLLIILIEVYVAIDTSIARFASSLQKRDFYYKSYKTIGRLICDESTVDGVLHYDHNLLDQLDGCARLEAGAKIALSNDTYAYEICQQIFYPHLTRNQILWETRCHWNPDKNEPYYRCLNDLVDLNWNATDAADNQTDLEIPDQFESDIAQNIKMLDCYKTVLNIPENASKEHEVLGNYSYVRFELSERFEYTKQLLCDSLRKQSDTDCQQRAEQYFKCFDSLSADCGQRLNTNDNRSQTLSHTFNTSLANVMCDVFEFRFHLSLEAVIQKCEFASGVKVTDFYRDSQLTGKLRDVLSCQVNSLQLTQQQSSQYMDRVNAIDFLYRNYH